MLSSLGQFASSSSGLGSLGLNGGSFLIQLGTFIIALLVLRRWAFKPIIKIMNERRETIEKGVQLGQQMEKDKAELEAKVDKALHEARAKADDIINEARETAKQVVAESEEQAKTKASGVLAAADERLKQEASQARHKLEGEVASLVAEATEAIIHEKLDAKKDNELIKRTLKDRQAA